MLKKGLNATRGTAGGRMNCSAATTRSFAARFNSNKQSATADDFEVFIDDLHYSSRTIYLAGILWMFFNGS